MIRPAHIAIVSSSLLLAGCVTPEPSAGFDLVSSRSGAVTGAKSVWVQNSEQARAAAEQTSRIVRNKTLSADQAVQAALLNNKGLQAAYANVGISAAEVWQQSMGVNPVVSIGVPGIGVQRAVETTVVANIISLMTRKKRLAIADARLRQSQLQATEATLKLAADTRRAWVEAVAAWERVAYLNRAQATADAASALAAKLGKSGAYPKAAQAREHVFYAELAGQTAEARMQARSAKEALARLMGVWGNDLDFKVPNALPGLPRNPLVKKDIESNALRSRIDLQIARLELEALAASYDLTNATRTVTDIDLVTGVEVEVEKEDGETRVSVALSPELEFTIPIFDSGKARMRKAELAYMQAANLLAEKAVNIRSEARSSYDSYRSSLDIARHYRNNVLPLRTDIEQEALLTYNGMITSTFDLLADTRAKVNSVMLSLNAKRQFWLADINVGTAVYGGGAGGGGGEMSTAVAAAEGGGGH